MNQKNWHAVITKLLNELREGESLAVSLAAEDSLFVRMTQAKVRQSSEIEQGFAEISFFKNNRNVKFTLPFTFQHDEDLKVALNALNRCREEAEHFPEDPFIQLPVNDGRFQQVAGEKISRYTLTEQCLSKVKGQDFTGLLAAGEMVRANMNSSGLEQWFETSTFSVDFSFYTQNQQAVKGLYGGRQWQDQDYNDLISRKLLQLDYLNHPLKTLEKGKYRTYFSPSGVAGLLQILSWRGVSREAYQRGDCALKKLVDREKTLSPFFSLRENFSSGEIPRFNEIGEIASELFPLIEQGDYKNLLCSSRSAKEYSLASNFANSSEALRAPEILSGTLSSENIMKELGTGLYVSHLHYLNWSDIQQGRITGMTRFGCFWIENGEIVAPVKDMRFDESLYHFWGQGLIGFTDKAETLPEIGTYVQRDLGTLKAPGMLVDNFTFVSAG